MDKSGGSTAGKGLDITGFRRTLHIASNNSETVTQHYDVL